MNYEDYLKAVEVSLKEHMPKPDGLNDRVLTAMEYSLLGGGKRLRPIIILSVCHLFGSYEKALPFAAAIEMIHTYSLIHDDLPAMDDDDYRRGRLSCHKKFDEWAAILAGDGLLNTAFEVMIEAVWSCDDDELKSRYIRAFRIIAKASGVKGMVGGQTADIEWENKTPDETILTDINEKKTGALISAAFEAGGVIGGANDSYCGILKEAGKKIGFAFQIKDDMLDYEGSFEKLGKLTGSDSKNNKTTYVSILGIEECSKRVKELSESALDLIKSLNKDTAFLEEMLAGLITRNK